MFVNGLRLTEIDELPIAGLLIGNIRLAATVQYFHTKYIVQKHNCVV